MKKNNKIGLISLGCAKNLVDSELMAGLLKDAGYEVTLDVNEAQTVIINTCSFIHDAECESVRAILDAINNKKRVIVTGCLPQKHKGELKELLGEVDCFLGATDYDKIVEAVQGKNVFEISEKPDYHYTENIEREHITIGASAYIKIADGCNYSCGYCVIPKLKGKYRSRKIEDIVSEAKKLGERGVGEIILIAQDTTNYGIDIYKKPSLAKLLSELNKIESINWIRVLYAYPTNFNDELIEAYKNLDKVVKYIDMPLQHSHPEMLLSMKRPVVDYEELIKKIRKNIKNVCLRTTLIVGYPGEEEKHFKHLYNFVKKMKFDRLGVFEFSREKGTYADTLPNQINSKIKKKRKSEIMKLQKEISKEKNSKLLGRKISCIIEQIREDGIVTGRSFRDAPEVDGLVYIKTKKPVVPCDIESVKITKFNNYDLFAIL